MITIDKQRFMVSSVPKERVGVLDKNNKIITAEYILDSLCISVYEDLVEIESDGKKREDTLFDIHLQALDSLSKAVMALRTGGSF